MMYTTNSADAGDGGTMVWREELKRWLRLMSAPSWSKPGLTVNYDYVDWTHGFTEKRLHWADIQTIESENMFKVIYAELFLILRDTRGNWIAVGELNEGFGDVVKMIEWRCPGFPSRFFPAPETELGVRKVLWTKA